MVYGQNHLHININKKRGTGIEDQNQLNTPVILDLACQLGDEKQSFFNQPNPFINRIISLDDNKSSSLQTPIINLNNHQTPFFNAHTNSILQNDSGITDFVSPNNVLQQTYPSSGSSRPNLNQLNSNYNDIQILNDHQNKQQILTNKHEIATTLNQTNYFTTTSSDIYPTQLNPYSTINQNLIQTDLNHNLTNSTNLNSTTHSNEQQHQNLVYTELKGPSQPDFIPNSVYDASNSFQINKNYNLQPPSPASSLSSQTSNSNLDNSEIYSSHHRSIRNRSQNGQSIDSKKQRMTKKQKFDQMVNEEKDLLNNNEKLKDEIKDLEDKIELYKRTIMNTVKQNK